MTVADNNAQSQRGHQELADRSNEPPPRAKKREVAEQDENHKQHPEVDLTELMSNAELCLMTLEDLHRDYDTMSAVSSRITGDQEDWHYADQRDETDYNHAAARIKTNMPHLTQLLPNVLNWGRQHGVDVYADLDRLIDDQAFDYTKAEECGVVEFNVRTVMNAIRVEQAKVAVTTKPGNEGAEDEQPPALTPSEQLTLKTLATFGTSFLASAKKVADAMDPGERLSERTIQIAVRRLIKLDLADRPEGPRKGARLQLKGQRLGATIKTDRLRLNSA